MGEKEVRLTKFQEDALKEVGNLGAGKASGALAKLIERTVLIEMTNIRIMPVDNVSSLIGGPKIPAVGILFYVSGELQGVIFGFYNTS